MNFKNETIGVTCVPQEESFSQKAKVNIEGGDIPPISDMTPDQLNGKGYIVHISRNEPLTSSDDRGPNAYALLFE